MKEVSQKTKKLKWDYARHIAHQEGTRWNKIISEWEPYDKKKRRESPGPKWRDYITKITEIMWGRVVQD